MVFPSLVLLVYQLDSPVKATTEFLEQTQSTSPLALGCSSLYLYMQYHQLLWLQPPSLLGQAVIKVPSPPQVIIGCIGKMPG